jgi:hypothetical protein
MKKLVCIAFLAIGISANAQEKEIELTCIRLNTIDFGDGKYKTNSDVCTSLKDNFFQIYLLDKVYSYDIIPNSFRIQYEENGKTNYEIFLATRGGVNFKVTHPVGGELYAVEDLKEKILTLYTNE